MKIISRIFTVLAMTLFAAAAYAAEPPLKLGVGLFQPDREKNDATYRPLADYLSAKLNGDAHTRQGSWRYVGPETITPVRQSKWERHRSDWPAVKAARAAAEAAA